MMLGTAKQWVTTVTAGTRKGDEEELLISTPSLDRDNDTLRPEGADLSAFRRNAPLMWAHDYSQLPIGTITAVDVSSVGLRARFKWLDGDPFADRVQNAWRQGVVRAASIGFRPLEFVNNEHGGRTYTKWELLEVSLVAVPANAEAVRTLKALT